MARVRILLVRLSALGDVVSGLPVLSTIHERIGSAQVDWVVEDRFAALLEGHPQIHTLHIYRRRPWWRGLRLTRSLRARKYDLALDLQGNLKSGVLARLSGARRCMGLGGSDSREGNHLFVRERVEPEPGEHHVDSYMRLLDAAIGEGPAAFGKLHAEPEPHDAIVFHPFVSAFFLNKRWPPAFFAALGDRLAEGLQRPVILTAGPGEREQAEAIVGRMRRGARIVEPPGLKALKDVLAGARLFVGADTGPTHIAAALGVPTLALLGPTGAARIAPHGPRAGWVSAHVRCSPCKLRWCPDPVCMASLSVEQAEAAALELVG
jgi:heptosyltransferase-1